MYPGLIEILNSAVDSGLTLRYCPSTVYLRNSHSYVSIMSQALCPIYAFQLNSLA